MADIRALGKSRERGAMSRRRLRQEARIEAAGMVQPLAGSLLALVAARRPKARAALECRIQVADDVDIPVEFRTASYRICEAALENALRHAGAYKITVELIHRHDRLIVRIADDGAGFDLPVVRAGARPGCGLDVMQECAREAGGKFEVRSAPGAGTCVSVLFALPLQAADTNPKAG
jgi:signal transduction histidine kinase